MTPASPQPFRGVVVPMLSPFTPSGTIDVPAVGRLVEMLLAGGVDGIFPLGTTGESASIGVADRLTLVEATVAAVRGRAIVYAGISSNAFRESIEAARQYQQIGVQAAVAHVPSYFPISDAQVERYFATLADAIPLPLVLYNIPVTTHHSIPIDAVERLSRHGNIRAIKDSAGDAQRLTNLLTRTGGVGGFPVLLGSSGLFSHGLRLGAVGMVPSGGHLVAREYQLMFGAAMRKDWDEVERLQRLTSDACAVYVKERPLGEGLAVLKAILEGRGICSRTMLPPLSDHVGDVPRCEVPR